MNQDDKDGLWDPVERRDEPEVRAELPVAKVVSMPAAKPAEPAMAFDKLLKTLIQQLEDGNVNAAFAIEEDWREAGGKGEAANKQWQLTQELLGVASELPVPVVQALANGIAVGDFTASWPALDDFKKADPKAASAAHGLLALRARRLFDGTANKLYTAPPPRPDYYANYVPPSVTRSSSGMSGWRVVSLGAVVLSAILRIAASSHNTYDYDYHPIELPPLPQYDPNLYTPPAYDPTLYTGSAYANYVLPNVPPAPVAVEASDSRDVLLDDMISEAQSISTYSLVPDESMPKVQAFVDAGLDDQCGKMKTSFAALAKLKPVTDDAEKAAAFKQQVAAIKTRLPIVCGKKQPTTR
ncbi:MAG: hypothetical protein JO257_07685 [Deltaproteobacteria bacterium]|nr:hypothetical protein [Deltaproteobacteria bacterium]